MNNHRVLVIGNAWNVHNYLYKSFVDDFDVVIRINDAIIDGFEHIVGTKMDILFRGALHSNTEFIPNRILQV